MKSVRTEAAPGRKHHVSRTVLLHRIQRRLVDPQYPRVQMMLILALAGLVSALASFLMLHLGLQHMGLRYALAALIGYLAFVVLIRLWASRRQSSWDVDVGSAADWPMSPSDDSTGAFGGGRSGGGGGGAGWDETTPERASGADGLSLDADELWPVLLVAACLAAGVLAVAYVVYLAPVLLAEVALETVVVGAVYRRTRRLDSGMWATTVFRRTWVPALVLLLSAGAAGIGAQWLLPTADSIGDVLRELVVRS